MNNKNVLNESLSYEEQQLQMILLQEMQRQSIIAERELRKQQDQEYLDASKQDALKNKIEFNEISIEEMREKRLKRFCASE